MHLKRLELHGYKSFANRTEFQFYDGITAIVGPNGSGKSNVADAIQWVLGEQSYSVLRAKRTEDMIFAGSASRVRMGMAEVSMTFDNSTGWLPIEFSEVTVTRRAYRSGENEYLLNGARTRLRDIAELLAKGGLGRGSYVVIGQGLIDSAISLRPEERRTLLEDAAGISLYQSKKSDALSKLAATQENLTRAGDILRELEPRVRRLREQANRAGQFSEVQRRLAEHLQEWYGYQWQSAQARLAEAHDEAARSQEASRAVRDALQASDRERAALREQIHVRRQAVNDWQRRLNDLTRDQQELARRRAVAGERLSLLAQQRDDLLRELEALAVDERAGAERAEQAEAELARLEATAGEATAALQEVRARAEERDRARRASQMAGADAQRQALEVARGLAELTQRIAGARERARLASEAIAQNEQAALQHAADLRDLDERLAVLRVDLDSLLLRSVAHSEEHAQAKQQAEEAQRSAAALASDAAEAQAGARAAQAQLAAARAGGLDSVLAVASTQGVGSVQHIRALYHVSPEHDRTVRAALGSFSDALVVATWSDARRLAAGLQTRQVILVLESFASDGTAGEGTALSLVSSAPEHRALFGTLLGRVSLNGSVGGTRVEDDGWLVLPHALTTVDRAAPNLGALEDAAAGAQSRAAHLEARLAEARAANAHWTAERDRSSTELQALQADLARRQAEYDALRRDRDRLEQDREHRDANRARLGEERSRLEHQISEWEPGLDALRVQQEALPAAFGTTALEEDPQSLARELAQQETRAALLAQEHATRRQGLAQARERATAIAAQQRAKQSRADALAAETERLASESADSAPQLEALEAQIAEVNASLQPAAEQLASDEASLRDIEAGDKEARERLYAAESAHSQALVELQRREDRVATLRDQIESDYEFVALTTDLPAPLALELDENRILRLPHVTAVSDTLESEVRSLKNKMRWIGNVNLEAPSEYALEKARLEFLQVQSTDLQRASESLQQLVQELDTLMQQKFQETFRAVARAFKDYFTKLFGGGSAELVLTEPQNIGSTGIDIIAHPPGKRRQPLGLLSGGERALTAGALVFALLKISAAPFCVMDEVDAALDEANIGRFRATLTEAAAAKQILIVTHNRGTVEAAGTVYGISMGADGASQMISLRLEGAETGETVPQLKAA